MFDIPLYESYLKNTPFACRYFSGEQVQSVQKRVARVPYSEEWRAVHRLETGRWKSQEDFHQDYLEAHFRVTNGIKPFDQYFDTEFLQKKLARSQLYRGEKVEGLADMFSSAELKAMNEERQLTLAKGNQAYFRPGEQVVLNLETKNIPSLQVLVY